jgi:hypothetical protein
VECLSEPTDAPARNGAVNQEVTLGEEEVSDISLATFHVFDHESQAGERLACGCGSGCCLFARAPSSALGNDIYSPLPHRLTGRGHKQYPEVALNSRRWAVVAPHIRTMRIESDSFENSVGQATRSATGRGSDGWLEHAPFDRMIVTAAPDLIPLPLATPGSSGRGFCGRLDKTYQ